MVSLSAHDPGLYEIRVQGVLDRHWSEWFDGLEVASDPEGRTTTISGPLDDDSALCGVLSRVCELALPLVSIRRLDLGE